MGADLYRSDHAVRTGLLTDQFNAAALARNETEPGSPEYYKAQEEVERIYDLMYPEELYFRDSYNSSNLLGRFELSYWRDFPNIVGPNGDGVTEKVKDTYIDTDGNVVEYEYEDFRLHAPGIEKLLVMLKEHEEDFVYSLRNEEAENAVYFTDKYGKLVRFLQGALDGGYTIYCSV